MLKQGLRLLLSQLACVSIAVSPALAGPKIASAKSNPSDPSVHLSIAQSRSFSDALTALAVQAHVAFVVEGVPLHSVSDEKSASSVLGIKNLASAVDAVAAVYGYRAERRGSLFLLQKLYSDPYDLPPTAKDECLQILLNYRRILASFNPNTPPNKVVSVRIPQSGQLQYKLDDILVNEFARSLSPVQLQTMHGGFLRAETLTHAQQALIRLIILRTCVQQPLNTVDGAIVRMQKIDQDTLFHWGDAGVEKHLFGYDTHLGARKAAVFFPLSGAFAATSSLGYVAYPTSGPEDIVLDDPTSPLSISIDNTGAETSTLASVVSTLNNRYPSKTAFEVQDALKNVPTTVVGLNNALPEQVMEALAVVNGFSLINSDNGMKMLALPPVQNPHDTSGIYDAIRAAFPKPLLQSFHVDTLLALDADIYNLAASTIPNKSPNLGGTTDNYSTPNSSDVEETLDDLKQAMQKRRSTEFAAQDQMALSKQKASLEQLPIKIRFAAIRSLRTSIQPKLVVTSYKSIPLSDLGQFEHNALAFIMLVDCFRAVGSPITRSTPGYLIHPETALLSGGLVNVSSTRTIFSLKITSASADERNILDMFEVNVDYIK